MQIYVICRSSETQTSFHHFYATSLKMILKHFWRNVIYYHLNYYFYATCRKSFKERPQTLKSELKLIFFFLKTLQLCCCEFRLCACTPTASQQDSGMCVVLQKDVLPPQKCSNPVVFPTTTSWKSECFGF